MDPSTLIKSPYLTALLNENSAKQSWTSINDVKCFYRKLWPQESCYSVRLIRVGSDNDGGYLMPANFDDLNWCFSPGSAGRADFENDLHRLLGIKSFICDDWSEEPENNGSVAGFTNRLIDYGPRSSKTMTMREWISLSLPITPARGSLILQMDIEGGEYPFLLHEEPQTFEFFKYIIVELHYLHMLHKQKSYEAINAGLDKLLKTHKPVHIHPNDHTIYGSIDGHPVAHCIEVTFELALPEAQYVPIKTDSLPHALDQPNIKANKLVAFPKF